MKYKIICQYCDNVIENFTKWYSEGQCCSKCGSTFVNVEYDNLIDKIKRSLNSDNKDINGLNRYYEILPIESKKNCINAGENNVSIERWTFLEKYAQMLGYNLQVYAHRHDNNPATGTFKDLAGSNIASILKEIGAKYYTVASTGNVGVALSRYLSEANISLHVFLPKNASLLQEAEISCFGQKVYRVNGDYTYAKQLCARFAAKHDIPISPNLYDPVRIEAKKTMAYEWVRQKENLPDVYIKALSGGTGPLGIAKGSRELIQSGYAKKIPRLLLVQSDSCDPMSQSWRNSKCKNFPDGWQNSYCVIENPETDIPTLATGAPHLYPVVSDIVKESNGEIFSFPESLTIQIARLVAYEVAVRIGPAASITVGGFLRALHYGYLYDKENIILAIGEGIRRSPKFLESLQYTSDFINDVTQCELIDRVTYRNQIWKDVIHKL